MSKHLKATILSGLLFGLMMGLWDLLTDRSLKYTLTHSLVMAVGYGVIMYFVNIRKSESR